MRIESHICICSDDGSHRNGRSKVGKGIDVPSSERYRQTQCPDEIRDKEYNARLVQAVGHVHPKLGSRVFQAANATDVELREGQSRLGINVLVER